MEQSKDTKFRNMTVPELAAYLRRNRSTIYRMVQENRLPCFKIGGGYRFRRDVIDAWLAEKEIKKGRKK